MVITLQKTDTKNGIFYLYPLRKFQSLTQNKAIPIGKLKTTY